MRQLLCVAFHGRGAQGNRQDPHEDSEWGGSERLQVSLMRLEPSVPDACVLIGVSASRASPPSCRVPGEALGKPGAALVEPNAQALWEAGAEKA